MKVGYMRVSTQTQKTERQEIQLKEWGVQKVYTDKLSGKARDRPQLNELLSFIREGDIVIVSEFSRLARNTKDLLEITETITSKGASFKSLKESIDTTTPAGKMMLTVIGAIATFEREILLERQAEGIAIAKAKGKFAKPILAIPIDFKEKLEEHQFSKSKLAKHYDVSRPTIYNWLVKFKSSVDNV